MLGVVLMILGGAGCQFDQGGADYGSPGSPDAEVVAPDASPADAASTATDEPDAGCGAGACLCAPPLSDCGAAGCVDLDRDRDHCGSCERKCRADEVCTDEGCARFRVRESCDSCPCNACDDDDECGVHFDGSGRIICIEGDD